MSISSKQKRSSGENRLGSRSNSNVSIGSKSKVERLQPIDREKVTPMNEATIDETNFPHPAMVNELVLHARAFNSIPNLSQVRCFSNRKAKSESFLFSSANYKFSIFPAIICLASRIYDRSWWETNWNFVESKRIFLLKEFKTTQTLRKSNRTNRKSWMVRFFSLIDRERAEDRFTQVKSDGPYAVVSADAQLNAIKLCEVSSCIRCIDSDCLTWVSSENLHFSFWTLSLLKIQCELNWFSFSLSQLQILQVQFNEIETIGFLSLRSKISATKQTSVQCFRHRSP